MVQLQELDSLAEDHFILLYLIRDLLVYMEELHDLLIHLFH